MNINEIAEQILAAASRYTLADLALTAGKESGYGVNEAGVMNLRKAEAKMDVVRALTAFIEASDEERARNERIKNAATFR